MSYIAATATGYPPNYYPQEDILAFLGRLMGDHSVERQQLARLQHNAGVQGRYLALPLERYGELGGFGTTNDLWLQVAGQLGERTLRTLLAESGLPAEDVTMLAFTTVTGVSVPSLDGRLMNRIPFPGSLKRMPLFGLGCLGGAAGMARLADYLKGHPREAGILLSVELCSLTLQLDDLSPANLVSSSLFGDGSAAVLMVGREHPLARPEQPQVVDSRSLLVRDTEGLLGWDVMDSGFKIVLSPDLPAIARSELGPYLEAFLGDHELRSSDISHWILHPGGPKVLRAVEQGFALNAGADRFSWESLAEVGNVSSASVLIILDRLLANCRPDPGSYGLLMAMGPGFGIETVLLKW